jgi:hypothetical protein
VKITIIFVSTLGMHLVLYFMDSKEKTLTLAKYYHSIIINI